MRGYPITIAKSSVFLSSNNYITFEEYETYLKKSSSDMENYVTILYKQLSSSTKQLLNQLVFFDNQNISKSLIQKIASTETFLEDLVDLNRYQIVSTKTQNDAFPIFEMHDQLREAIFIQMGSKQLKETLDALVDKVNKLIPKGKNTKQELVLSDYTLLGNLEELLVQAEKHQIEPIKILELKKNLMSFFLGMGLTRCQDLKSWFLDNQENLKKRG